MIHQQKKNVYGRAQYQELSNQWEFSTFVQSVWSLKRNKAQKIQLPQERHFHQVKGKERKGEEE